MRLSFSAGAVLGNKLFFSDNYCNALVCVNLETKKTCMVTSFNNQPMDAFQLHKKCINYDGKFIFVPNRSEYLHIYDLNNNVVDSIKISRTDSGHFVFSDAMVIGDILYIIPANANQPLLRINIQNKEVEELFKPLPLLEGRNYNTKQTIWKACSFEKMIYMPVLGEDYLIFYDTAEKKAGIIEPGIPKLYSMYTEGNRIFVCTGDQKVFDWNDRINQITEIKVNNSENVKGSYMVTWDGADGYYAIPDLGKTVYELNKEKNCFEEIFTIEDSKLNSGIVNFENYCRNGNEIILFPREDNDIYVIGADHSYQKLTVLNDSEEYEKIYLQSLRRMCSKEVVKEGKPYLLSDFRKSIV